MHLPTSKNLSRLALSGLLLSIALPLFARTAFAEKSLPYTEVINAPTIVGYPASIASTGDSITRGYNTGSVPFTDAPANSWSTGTNISVNPHYNRILPNNPAIDGQTYNDAVTGAVMADLNGQVANAVTQNAQYITILLGANDACADTEGEMTSVATYRAQFEAGIAAISAGLPDARIYVMSVPNIYNLWSILKDNSSARFTWSLFSICQAMLANPQSTVPADVERRNRVRQRVVDYNTQLAQVCTQYIHCRFDNNAVFNTNFVPDDVSTRDYFHPSITGQAKLAEQTYLAGFDFRDGVAPASTATLSAGKGKSPNSVNVTLSAVDNVAVSGIEYKINSGPFLRYTSPVNLPTGSSITYRAVDINGTIETSRTLTPAPQIKPAK